MTNFSLVNCALIGLVLLLVPSFALAVTQTVVLTSGSSWTVPSNWNNSDNSIEVIGGGGGGGGGPVRGTGAGGGGGGYAKSSNISLTVGNIVSYSIGSGGAGGAAGSVYAAGTGGATWFNGGNCGSSAACAYGGAGGRGGGFPGGTGGAGAVGSILRTGGSGAGGGAIGQGGGGGAAGPSGNGGGGSGSSGGAGGGSPAGRGGNLGSTGQVYGGAGGGGHTLQGGGAGAKGIITITWTDPPPQTPSCSISISPSTVNEGASATLSWSSSSADWFYITNIGYVSGSGSTSVTPSVTTAYDGTVENAVGSGSCSGTLTVHPSCTLDGQTITHGSSITAYSDDAPAYGGSCTSQSRTCTDGTLSGSYAYASCTVADPLSCTLDGATIAHGESASFYSSDIVSGGVCSSYEATRTCSNGTLSGEDTYTYASCSCVAAYTCSGQTIQYTNTSCSTSNVTTCVSPNFCSTGAPACLSSPPSFTSQGSFTGHLEIRPAIVPSKGRARVHWDLSNVESCSVTGDNGDSWTGASSGVSGQQTAAITQKTSYTLACTGLDGSTIEETQILNILPKFNES